MKDIFEVINSRRSVRSYKKEQLTNEEIEKILNAGIMAPTAMGEQPWHFTVVQNEKILKEINLVALENMAKSDNEFLQSIAKNGANILHNAPTVIVVSGRENNDYIQADCSAAIENMLLAAEGLDIGSCWIALFLAYFTDNESKRKLEIPEGYTPVYGVTLGYKLEINPGNPNRNKNVVNWLE